MQKIGQIKRQNKAINAKKVDNLFLLFTSCYEKYYKKNEKIFC